jgi:hypothetical protein
MSEGIGIQSEVAGDAANRHTRHAPLAEVMHHGVEQFEPAVKVAMPCHGCIVG